LKECNTEILNSSEPSLKFIVRIDFLMRIKNSSEVQRSSENIQITSRGLLGCDVV